MALSMLLVQWTLSDLFAILTGVIALQAGEILHAALQVMLPALPLLAVFVCGVRHLPMKPAMFTVCHELPYLWQAFDCKPLLLCHTCLVKGH